MPTIGTTGGELLPPNPNRAAFHVENTHATLTLYISWVDGPGNISSTTPGNITIKAGQNADITKDQGAIAKRGWAVIGAGAGVTYNISEYFE